MRSSRREVLAALMASACGLPTEPGPGSSGFPLAVACGDVTDTRALLWTLFVGTGPLWLEVWPRERPDQVRALPVEVALAGAALLDLEGLLPSTWYQYRFVARDDSGVELDRSDTGLFTTAPALDALVPLTFGVASCARQTEPLGPLLVAARDYVLDSFLLLGDSVYTDGASTLDQYRAVWRKGLARWPNRLLRGSTSLIATWDDHEIRNDASGDRLDPAQLVAATNAFFEHQPVRPTAPSRVWRSLRWGRTAEIFVLDCRSERDHATGEYISARQLQWLEDGLAASPAVFKLVMNSVPISNYPGALYGVTIDDRWQGWPTQRQALVNFVDQHRDGVLWLTGDFHMGIAGRVALEGPGSTQLEVAAGPAGSNMPNPALSYPSPPQFDFASAVNNVVVLDLEPVSRTARVRFVAADRRVLFDHTYQV